MFTWRSPLGVRLAGSPTAVHLAKGFVGPQPTYPGPTWKTTYRLTDPPDSWSEGATVATNQVQRVRQPKPWLTPGSLLSVLGPFLTSHSLPDQRALLWPVCRDLTCRRRHHLVAYLRIHSFRRDNLFPRPTSATPVGSRGSSRNARNYEVRVRAIVQTE